MLTTLTTCALLVSACGAPIPARSDGNGDGQGQGHAASDTASQAASHGATDSNNKSVIDVDADFRRRAEHPDVLRAVSFDTERDVTDNLFPDGNFISAGSGWDQSTKASGAGSLRFVIRSGSPPGGAGSWRINASDPPFKIKFGANEEFYVQWRQRFSRELLETVFRNSHGFKQIIIGEADYADSGEARSCTELEIVVQNLYRRGFPQMYHSCGLFAPFEEPYRENDFKLQNGLPEPFCLYSEQSNPQRCLRYVAGEWMTFQVRVALGPRGTAKSFLRGAEMTGFINSTVQMWAAREGAPARLIHDWKQLVLRETEGVEYGKIWLLPYQTDKDSTQEHQEAYTWYDELIVSTSRIADPGSAVAERK